MTATTNTTQTTATESPANSNSITTVESLVREARRRGFNVQGGFHPPDLLPFVEAAIADHNKRERGYTENSADYIEWKQIMDNLQEFHALLKSLPDRLPYGTKAATSTPPTKGASTREKIEKLKKQSEDHLGNTADATQEQLTTVGPPSEQASDPRRTPVGHPSKDASDASINAFLNAHVFPPLRGLDQPGDSESISAKIERERAEYLAQVLRESAPNKSPIDDLPPDRQQTLYQLIHEHPLTAVVKMVRAPEPIGWNLKTCDTSLRRFKERYKKKLEAAELAGAFTEAQETIQQTGADEQTYMNAARRLLKVRLYKNAADPEGSAEELELLIRLLDRQRRTDLAERRVAVAEQRAHQ